MLRFAISGIAVLCFSALLAAQADRVTRETVPGITNFARVETTIACAGATNPEALAAIRAMGFASVINLREAHEDGVDIAGEEAAALEAGLRFVHLPLNSRSPDPAVAAKFLTIIGEPASQPAFIHCASGNRAAAMWLVKRLLVDRWDTEDARAEARALGLTSETLEQFALDYANQRR